MFKSSKVKMNLAQKTDICVRMPIYYLRTRWGQDYMKGFQMHRTHTCYQGQLFWDQNSWESDLASLHFMESTFIFLLSIWTVERQIRIMSARRSKINNLLSGSFSSFLAQLSHGYPVEMLWVLEIMYTKPNNKTWPSKPVLATLPRGSEKARHCLS